MSFNFNLIFFASPSLPPSVNFTKFTSLLFYANSFCMIACQPISKRLSNYLDANFMGQWIVHGRPAHWSPRFPDLSSFVYFLWGNQKGLWDSSWVNWVAGIPIVSASMCENLESLELFTSHSFDAIKHVLLLMLAILNIICYVNIDVK